MDNAGFERMVARLEQESARSAGTYRAKVAALALLGFGILALVVLLAGLGLVLLAALVVALVYTGGAALILLLKLGKGLVLVALALWFLVRSALRALFVRLPVPAGVELRREQAPALFEALDLMRRRLKGPRVHHVRVVDEVNAAVVQRPAFGLFGWPRNHLLLGMPLLEAMPPDEALAVVAHEYGHLAGAHGRFEAFIYRLRLSWATIQQHADVWQGWAGRPLQWLVRWYAPYFNAYTFVLARANEYQADAASVDLVGAEAAARALKRVNLVAPRYEAFIGRTFERIAAEPQPPADLQQRWAGEPEAAPADAQRWLDAALAREPAAFDTHPALRQRLGALPGEAAQLTQPPAPVTASAAQAWLGPMLDTLRAHFSAEWAGRVAQPWGERHAELQQQRQRLAALREQAERSSDETLEMLNLQRQHEPENDVRPALQDFNAAHPGHALGLYIEGLARLDRDDAEGVALIERAIQIDPDATLPTCERLHGFYRARQDTTAAEAWAERWRQRAEFEQRREAQRSRLDITHTLVPAALDEAMLAAVRERLTPTTRADLKAVYLVRRQLPADPQLPTYVLALELTWLARLLRRHAAVRDRLAALPWPMHLMVLPLNRSLRGYAKRLRGVAGARIA